MPATEGHTLVFGLTADPIHRGHEQVIHNSFAFAQSQGLPIQRFLMVPTYQPNLIAGKQLPRTAFNHRLAMCELVAKAMRKQFKYPVYITDTEKKLFIKNGQKSYSIDTLAAIDAPAKLFVLSADHFAGRWPKFRKWHRWQELVQTNGLLIHQRPGHGLNATFIQQLQAINPHVYVVKDLPAIDVSSTQIRHTGPAMAWQQAWISEPVHQYILTHKLYP
ncbi:nicotinate-nicotinamide nucleotide adenylyltransferase [Marinicella meishanensis]|uniref:nicotinate-nicotinamide nucleotide adenylyltransferase n=1 Tax=Marinicella meishanensis TaxID=2873263 RepID=UPI001CBF3DA2|nr:nicotinate-nicotinamide nucleotide adenylyltransferase [Marinicella sp. NBU2979]